MNRIQYKLPGYTLTELMGVIVILGLLAAVILPRVIGESNQAHVSACQTHRGNIEIQVELWMNQKGVWPTSNLSDIGADISFFPEGLPTCPVDSSAYTIDTLTGRVIGHNH